MGLMPKPKGPSAAEIKAQREERERLASERKQAELEADRQRELRNKSIMAQRRRTTGRGSLISGSELGTKGTLG